MGILLPEYLKYWGLSKPPFSLTPDPEMLYMSGQHQEGLLRLKYAVVSNKGGAMLVSENAGDGKTTLLAKLRGELHRHFKGGCNIVFIDHPTLTANQMVGEIARQLGVQCNTTDKPALLNELRENLLQSYRQGIKCVVMLDEGQMLCHRPDILQELRILLNFCVSDSFLLTFILSGQKPLDEAIRAMPEFHQRLPVRFFLRNLNREDTREMINFRLHQAGLPEGRDIFSEDGYTGIFNHSRGCPRVICSVADLSLVIAHSRYLRQVDFVSVSQACSDMNRTEGGYHYHYFLKSFEESAESRADKGPEMERSCPICGEELPGGGCLCPRCSDSMKMSAPPEEPEKILSTPTAGMKPGPRTPLRRQESKSQPETEDEQARPEEQIPQSPAPEASVSEDLSPARQDDQKEKSGKKILFEIVESVEETVQSPTLSSEYPAVKSMPRKTAADPEASSQAAEEEAPAAVEEDKNETIKCPFCGMLLDPDARSCANCGEIIAPEPAPDAPQDMAVGIADPGGGNEAAVCCGSCGGTVKEDRCPRCGNPARGKSAEMELVSGLEQCGLARLIVSPRYLTHAMPPDPLGEEIVFLAPGRFWSRSAVAQYFNGNGRRGISSRCGLSLRGTRMNIILRGEDHRLSYASVREAFAEPVLRNGEAVLFRLVLTTDSGRWLFTLPFRGECGRSVTDLLARYIRTRCETLKRIAETAPVDSAILR